MKFKELCKLLESNGWEKETGWKAGGKHDKYVHPDFKNPIIVGRHPGREVPTGTLNTILKAAGLK